MLKLLKYLRPYAWQIVAVVVLVFGQAMADLNLPRLMASIVDTGIVKNDVPFIWQTGGIMLAVTAGGMLCSILASFLAARVSMGLGMDLRGRVFARAEEFSLHEFDKFGTATLITRSTNDITQVQTVIFIILRMVISAPIMVVGGVIMAIQEDASLWWIIVGVVPILAAAIALIGSRALPLFKSMQKKLDRLNLVSREGLTGVRVIRAFNRDAHQSGRFYESNEDLTVTSIKVNRLMALAMPLMMFLMNITTIAIIWFGGHRIDAGEMQVGGLMAFLQYAIQIMFSLLMFAIVFVMVPRASASAERIVQVLNTEPSIKDAAVTTSPDAIRGTVEFQDVSFTYPGSDDEAVSEVPAVSGISFKVNPGETTAIIGGTGSGKTTLLNLILRFYDVQQGRILVDGVDVREMPQQELRHRIAYVPQKAVLFSGIVADNIRFGKPDATDEQIREAAEISQSTEFIDGMEGGFGAEVAQGGTNVSGGQKQRLSIARALVRRPEIYLFDDTFSALDFRTDARLRAAMKDATLDATVIIVAQRISTVMGADRIIVLDDGQVAGIGTHRELMQSSEVYREIAASQLSEEELA
jgi:ATP-binding cassette, subfamily B, multidrug efflux pump